MACNECKKRNTCISICTEVEIAISQKEVSRREIPLPDEVLTAIQEQYLEAKEAPYLDRHSQYLGILKEAIAALPKRQKQILKLHYFDGLTASEISRKLRISHVAVAKLLQKAEKNIKTYGIQREKSSEGVTKSSISRGTRA